jgi:Eukaryotic aspartyl protease
MASLASVCLLLISLITLSSAFKTVSNSLEMTRYLPGFQTVIEPFQDGMIVAHPGQYVVNITVGSQMLPFVIDTGSSAFWVIGSKIDCPGTFHETANNFHKTDDVTFDVAYGDGTVNAAGAMGEAKVKIGNIEIPRQLLGVATSGTFCDPNFSGFLGLGIVANAKRGGQHFPYDAPPQHMRKLGLIDESIFSMALSNQGGKLAFGGIPEGVNVEQRWAAANAHTGYFGFARLGKFNYWEITIDNIMYQTDVGSIENESGNIVTLSTKSFNSIVDNGVPNDAVDPVIAAKVASMYKPPAVADKRGNYIVNCDALPPTYGVTIGGETIWYKPENMIMSYTGGTSAVDWKMCKTPLRDAEWMEDVSQYESVLGAPFMRNVLAVFDFERPAVSFAPTI